MNCISETGMIGLRQEKRDEKKKWKSEREKTDIYIFCDVAKKAIFLFTISCSFRSHLDIHNIFFSCSLSLFLSHHLSFSSRTQSIPLCTSYCTSTTNQYIYLYGKYVWNPGALLFNIILRRRSKTSAEREWQGVHWILLGQAHDRSSRPIDIKFIPSMPDIRLIGDIYIYKKIMTRFPTNCHPPYTTERKRKKHSHWIITNNNHNFYFSSWFHTCEHPYYFLLALMIHQDSPSYWSASNYFLLFDFYIEAKKNQWKNNNYYYSSYFFFFFFY